MTLLSRYPFGVEGPFGSISFGSEDPLGPILFEYETSIPFDILLNLKTLLGRCPFGSKDLFRSTFSQLLHIDEGAFSLFAVLITEPSVRATTPSNSSHNLSSSGSGKVEKVNR